MEFIATIGFSAMDAEAARKIFKDMLRQVPDVDRNDSRLDYAKHETPWQKPIVSLDFPK